MLETAFCQAAVILSWWVRMVCSVMTPLGCIAGFDQFQLMFKHLVFQPAFASTAGKAQRGRKLIVADHGVDLGLF